MRLVVRRLALIFRYPDPSKTRQGAPLLHVEVLGEGRNLIVDVRGEIDLATFELLRAAIQYGLDKQPDRMSVQLSEVPFFGAAGLRVLVAAQKQADEQSVELILTAPSTQVLTVLKLAGLMEQFKITDGSEAHMPPPARERAGPAP